ncbi:UDP-glucosyltransferase UGT13248-like [Triticum dicoccoides]|uniref:UDP-glucosyltransferase UGT13248-like n=1 Tax=Triticum dicoccoides TaxID=85692 RepID=UPI00188F8C84|nr:UDP-glucosyltransferase UGT13248-like [Triticum dicoccoides]
MNRDKWVHQSRFKRLGHRLEAVWSEMLREILLSEDATSVCMLVYDSHLPSWQVARAAGVYAAVFFTQPRAVNIVYGEVWAGRLALPVMDGRELLAHGALGLELGPEDVPPFMEAPESLAVFLSTSIEQFDGLEDADDVLVNSFSGIEPKFEVFQTMEEYNLKDFKYDKKQLLKN